MKINKTKYLSIALVGAMFLGSCNKALDINDNPNSPTESTPALVMPQALVATANSMLTYHIYGSNLVGYRANAGGYSGWGTLLNYDFTNADYSGLWSTTYDILTDFDYVVNKTKEDQANQDYYFASLVLKAYNFSLLVDTYNDVPYSEALKGNGNLNPKYDKAQDIYLDLAKNLDLAINYFKTASTSSSFKNADVLFKGTSASWAKFANTLKLRLVLKGQGKVNFANATIDASIGVLDNDAIVNPGFSKQDGKQNPWWGNYAYNAAGTNVTGNAHIPTPYLMAFYNGTKLDDEERANLIFVNGVATNVNQLGYENNPPTGYLPSAWLTKPETGTLSATNYRGYGAVKGPKAGQPIMLASEASFLAAEAVLKGLLSGDAEAYFKKGVKQSYEYLRKDESDKVIAGTDAEAFYVDYVAKNAGSKLANFSLNGSNEEKLEAIITQKYIAFNALFGHEAWNEYRRTGYPKVTGSNSEANRNNTFASSKSVATTTDKLPTRILYPLTEYTYNADNVPVVDKFKSKIFWAK
ncbi:SusD/RagB family nutrient-binding outer membrane lipoprotein [Sphingobacterium lactis]|uniref:SusD/RagB family nutrient-binding outer membrane lipoprotein n=1 Tax=Sphingobacterium lactis TaxID=797291 RepID=UPI003DA69B1B